ncbi:hypothetical protein CLV46_1536 [Diaminobutyricimonas aerilata]|uniref:Uncharacterized protein n=1 Tax=Diaminobutyricimonas aerilata TaxID=1162967 RepID=A0A2M9CJ94_9MICO|nr:hypothetical protein [Diaminobutyricimonas aerilata]PJJ71977.1 hypothetical protein CLV46_1536 [Diaminobutyricimonas aerilata]
MTTSHEQPLSRRAARERERARLRGELPTERPTESTPEPLEYATRGAEGAPVLDAPRADEQPAGSASAEQDRPVLRDYSPEGRRSTPLTPSSFAPPAAPATPAVATSDDSAPQVSDAPEPPRTGRASDVAVPTGERTMTRRELRLLRARREAESGGTEPSTHTDAIDFLLKSGPIELPYLLPTRPDADAEAAEGAAEPEAARADAPEAEASASDSADTDAAEPEAIDAQAADEPRDEASTTDETAVVTDAVVEEPPALVEPAPLAPAFIEPPAADDAPAQASSDAAWAALLGRAQAQAEAGRPLDTPLDAIVPEVQPTADADETPAEAPVNGTGGDTPRPAEHWSQQATDDSRAAFEGGSTGSFAPSALVMPNAPHTGEFSYSLSTGEILVTGSIDLPRSLGSTGAHSDRIDDSSIDHVLDPRDQELTSTDSAPVRAVRAVSSHTSTRGMIATPPKKARSTKYLTALVIATSVMAVVAVTLLIVAAVTGNL